MSRAYDEDGRRTGRVLWGRLTVAGLALGAAFVLGRCSVVQGVEQTRYDEAQARISELEQTNRDLAEGRIAQAAGGIEATPDAAAETPAAQPSPASDDPDPSPGEEADSGGGSEYTIQEGDTLESIAERVYGDRSKYTLIADANQVDASDLRIGETLRIPANPDRR